MNFLTTRKFIRSPHSVEEIYWFFLQCLYVYVCLSGCQKSCLLHIFRTPCQIFTKLEPNILLINTTCWTKVTARSRSQLEVKGHGCQNHVRYIIFDTPHWIVMKLGVNKYSSEWHEVQNQGHSDFSMKFSVYMYSCCYCELIYYTCRPTCFW